MGGLDINLFRVEKGGNPQLVRQSCIKRNKDPKIVDEVIAKDEKWRQLRFKLDQLKKEWNNIGKQITQKKIVNKADPCQDQLKRKSENELKQKEVEIQQKEILADIQKTINSIGNLVHDSVPVSNDQVDNKTERTWGTIPEIKITNQRGGYRHDQVLAALDGFDPQRGNKISGHRGYFLKGSGVSLNLALIQYGIQFLNKHKYTVMQPPFFMKKNIMAETCQLSDFDDQLYKVSAGKTEEEQYYLIATSQQPISAMHRGQWIDQKQLPIKYSGYSSCFRKQAGAHGKDNWGIFRVHQFEKIEQFVICKPQDSWQAHQEMIGIAEDFYKSLELPYRVINIVSGALNDAASKKYDLEAWFPGYGTYRELVSCSNCTDFQSRNLEIRCGLNKKQTGQKKYVHMLNATLCATERTLCCILQNYQTQTGLRVPTVLQPFVGTDFLPYKIVQQKKQEKKETKGKQQKKKDDKKKQKKAETAKIEEVQKQQVKTQLAPNQQVVAQTNTEQVIKKEQ